MQANYTKVDMGTFHAAFTQAKEEHKTIIIIFKGTTDAATGENWCSDCVKAEGAIKEVLLPECVKQGLPVLECSVGDRAAWMDKSHPLRVNPLLKLAGVPTIVYFHNNQVIKRLEEEMCKDKEMLEEFIQ